MVLIIPFLHFLVVRISLSPLENHLSFLVPHWRHSFTTWNNEDAELLAQPLQCTINIRAS